MKRHGFDPKTPDFIWNKNRLAMEKEAIKKQMLNVINKKPAAKKDGKKDVASYLSAGLAAMTSVAILAMDL